MKKFIKTITTVALGLGVTMVVAAPVVVNKTNCDKLVGTKHPFILVLDMSDSLIDSITQCAKSAKLSGASISGLGQLHNPALAYFSSDPKAKPTVTNFSGFFELASMNGNVTANGDNYYTHVHVVLADKKFHGIAGHVNSAKVGLTAEVTVIPFDGSVERTVDAQTGFGPIVH